MILRLCRASAEPLTLRSCRAASVMPPIRPAVLVEPPGCLRLPPPGTVGQNVDPDVRREASLGDDAERTLLTRARFLLGGREWKIGGCARKTEMQIIRATRSCRPASMVISRGALVR